jgi:Cu(I)/Ag(I) efflux system membrane fusion protein
MIRFLTMLLIATLAGAGGWWLGSTRHSHAPISEERRPAYYQSTMHPWVKSDRPGKCTVCGMELVPVFAGANAHSTPTTDLVLLPEGTPGIANVKTAEVTRRPLERTLRVAGVIDDDESKHRILSAYTGGRIEKLFVNFEGAEVKAGQPLATFYSKELLAAVREYKVAFRQGPSPLLTATRVRLEQLGMNDEQIAKAHERPEDASFIEIVAPATGTVVKRYVYEGQYVQEGEKLFEIGDFSTMWFQFMAYEQDLPFLSEGLPVTVTTPSLPGKTLTSAIKFINPTLDGATRSARVRVELQNPTSERGLHAGHEVLHKLYAEGTVSLEAPDVIALPRQAVLWSGSQPRVFVEKGPGAYQQRQVILGRPGDEFWEVLEGVQPGDRVVASGNMLIDGQAQLNHLAEPTESTPPPVGPTIEMTAEDHQKIEAYLLGAARVTDALAADDLAAYRSALAKLPPVPTGLAVTPPAPAEDLASARRAFLPMSQAIADYARQVRGHFPNLRIFRCPMSNEIGAGAPENARWIQFTAELRNPYMGQEMLHCGAEVR